MCIQLTDSKKLGTTTFNTLLIQMTDIHETAANSVFDILSGENFLPLMKEFIFPRSLLTANFAVRSQKNQKYLKTGLATINGMLEVHPKVYLSY